MIKMENDTLKLINSLKANEEIQECMNTAIEARKKGEIPELPETFESLDEFVSFLSRVFTDEGCGACKSGLVVIYSDMDNFQVIGVSQEDAFELMVRFCSSTMHGDNAIRAVGSKLLLIEKLRELRSAAKSLPETLTS